MSWSARTTGLAGDIYQAATDGTQVVVVTGSNEIATSPDGVTWTPQTSPFGALSSPIISGIVWNGSVFCALAQDTSTQFVWSSTSSDGVTWAAATQVLAGTWASNPSLVFGSGTFIIVGQNTGDGFDTATSSDGATWTGQTTGVGGLDCGVFDGTQFVFGCNGGSSKYLVSTPDGVTWTSYSSTGFAGTVLAIAYDTASTTYIAADSTGASRTSGTADFSSSVSTTTGFEGGSVTGFAFDQHSGGLLIGVGLTSGSVSVSQVTTDESTWTEEDPAGVGFFAPTNAIIFALGLFFAYGGSGALATRDDLPPNPVGVIPSFLNDEGIGGAQVSGVLNLVEFTYLPEREPFLEGATNLIINRYKQQPGDRRQRGVDYTYFLVPGEIIQSVNLVGITAQGIDQSLTDPPVTPLTVDGIVLDPSGTKFAYTVSAGQDGIEYTVRFDTVTQVQTVDTEVIFSINVLVEDQFP